jgi:hypothetical protein
MSIIGESRPGDTSYNEKIVTRMEICAGSKPSKIFSMFKPSEGSKPSEGYPTSILHSVHHTGPKLQTLNNEERG